MTIFGRPCPARCPTKSSVNSLTTVCPCCKCRISVSNLFKPHTPCRQRTKRVIEELEQGLPPGKDHETCHPVDCSCKDCYCSIMLALEELRLDRLYHRHGLPSRPPHDWHRQYKKYSKWFNYCSIKTPPVQVKYQWRHGFGYN
jgi:hypothetical protein